ncbi:MAG: ABC transporter ATP-binding protein [Planctomycetes bacterium]|nr:ABC transporter ATP-binding protein [Planctomycetota bacterium]
MDLGLLSYLAVDIQGIESGLLWWMTVIIVYSLLRGFFLYATGFFRVMTIQHILHYMRSRLFNKVQLMELDWHHKHGTGELVTRTTRDCDMVRAAVESVFQIIEIAAMLTGSLYLLFSYNWQLALPPFLLMFIAVRMYVRQAKKMVVMNRNTDDAYDSVTQDIAEGVEGVRVVKAFALEKTRLNAFSGHVSTFVEHGLHALKYAVTHIPVPQLILSLNHPWVVFWGVVLMARGAETTFGSTFDLGCLVASLMAMTNIIFRLDGMGSAMRMISEAVASMQRLSEVIYAEPQIKSGGQEVQGENIYLSMRNVQAHDNQGNVIVENISLDVKNGEIVALVGSTGSGKSVLCSLLPALKSFSRGQIELLSGDGSQKISELEHHSLRGAIHVVPQESFLFSDTIAGNLRIACKEASDDELWTALEDAGIKDFIAGLDDGLESAVGERGMTLSGGQKQRLCLARALLARPQILVLDDSTSALDSLTEQRIFERLRSSGRKSAVLLVTTRLSSVLLADRVMMLADGEIVATGTHQDLARDDQRYQELLCLAKGQIDG